MERALLSAALPHRTGRAVRSGYAEGGVRTHSRKDLGNGIRVYGLGLGEEAYGDLGYKCKGSGNKGLRVTEFFGLRVRIYGLRVRILPLRPPAAFLVPSDTVVHSTRTDTATAGTAGAHVCMQPLRTVRCAPGVHARNMHPRTWACSGIRSPWHHGHAACNARTNLPARLAAALFARIHSAGTQVHAVRRAPVLFCCIACRRIDARAYRLPAGSTRQSKRSARRTARGTAQRP
jgi:hypothetical protein